MKFWETPFAYFVFFGWSGFVFHIVIHYVVFMTKHWVKFWKD